MANKHKSDNNSEASGFNPNQHPKAAESNNSDDSSEKNSEGRPENKLEEMKALADKNLNDFLYLRADFENYKKHVIKERADYLKYGSERLVTEVLGVLDNFERALDTKITSDNFSNFVKGVEMTAQELRSVLQKFGVSEIPSQNKAFDPNIHEALSSEESKEVAAGHILRVFKKAYKLHDRIVRPGQVVVAKPPAQ